MARESFKVHVTKDYLKFSAAHFIAYPGFREKLHGHNYRVSVEVQGRLGANGYVIDFAVVKNIARRLCERLNERTLVPLQSDCLTISEDGPHVVVGYERDEFRIPRTDVVLLPIVHTSAEELARYLAGELRRELQAEGIAGLEAIEIGVEETTGQTASYREEG
ncbi:MAG: 6-carboxytetrahydropterin synthase [Deltaproteobacteria bacterium]|nr:6-carboxytetrahydropterin synthase [Deltaproteobacteria bacterium]